MVQAVSCWPPNVEAQVQSQASPYGICDSKIIVRIWNKSNSVCRRLKSCCVVSETLQKIKENRASLIYVELKTDCYISQV